MAKKRKCRYSNEELEIHEKAVKLRKMTDRQLVEKFESTGNGTQSDPDAPEICHETGKAKDNDRLEKLLTGLAEGNCKGIKNGTVFRITEFCRELGLI